MNLHKHYSDLIDTNSSMHGIDLPTALFTNI